MATGFELLAILETTVPLTELLGQECNIVLWYIR
jgi:hypothetical protein